MRLSEAVIIYLSTAAPFGVAHFLHGQSRPTRQKLSLATAAGVALLWPLAAFRLLHNRHVTASIKPDENDGDAHASSDESKIERAKRDLINSLRAIEDLSERMSGWQSENHHHEMFAARECVERYTGLMLAASTACRDDAPARPELELCRIAGRTGEDLLLAGRCTHRRNVSRLLAHRERARVELIHALAAVRELVHAISPTPPQNIPGARRITEVTLHTFARAIELLSLLDDRETAIRVSRLLDAECARLRSQPITGRATGAKHSSAPQGEGLCTTPVALKAFAVPHPPTTM